MTTNAFQSTLLRRRVEVQAAGGAVVTREVETASVGGDVSRKLVHVGGECRDARRRSERVAFVRSRRDVDVQTGASIGVSIGRKLKDELVG